MKDSVKANLIVFFIIAIVAFGMSNAFASLIIQEDSDSYKLIPIENDSFEPNYIYKVPTIIPKVENNTTDVTPTNNTDYNVENTYSNWTETRTEYTEYW